MNKIKVGDWVEVVETDVAAERYGVTVGDTFVVSGVLKSGHIAIELGKSAIWHASPRQFKKTAAIKKERVASSHYQNANNNDVWQFVDDNLSAERVKGFHQTNAIKYVTRYHVKHDAIEKRIEDLEKAKECIDKLIELEREG